MDVPVEAYDSAIWQVVPEKVTVEPVAIGFGFTEGPVWCGDYLLFSDIPRNRIICWRMRREGPEVITFRSPSGNSNGLTLDSSGRLIACEHSTRRLTRTEIDGSVSVLAERYQGRRLNSPNDVVVRSDGSVYFTDPSYGLGPPPAGKELPFNGVYRYAPDGELVLLLDDFDAPNGLAFSPDETVLYVDDSVKSHIRAFDVSPDGSLSNGRVLIDMQSPEAGVPDGMKVDQQGNIYCTGPWWTLGHRAEWEMLGAHGAARIASQSCLGRPGLENSLYHCSEQPLPPDTGCVRGSSALGSGTSY